MMLAPCMMLLHLSGLAAQSSQLLPAQNHQAGLGSTYYWLPLVSEAWTHKSIPQVSSGGCSHGVSQAPQPARVPLQQTLRTTVQPLVFPKALPTKPRKSGSPSLDIFFFFLTFLYFETKVLCRQYWPRTLSVVQDDLELLKPLLLPSLGL